ncbi:MAG: hypothetical protein CH6_1097 [Candidatus Kapaibacterium sp.]|nr:MAG: hypothetical protein CH6_1095 [Candidatus Kapabacteria bacterium]QLH53280.1 MAG: hypothetical protein CH6_1097 [Candidatus Kapabacteria bacterium]
MKLHSKNLSISIPIRLEPTYKELKHNPKNSNNSLKQD